GYCFFQKGDYERAAQVYYELMNEAADYKLPESVYRWVADYYLSVGQFKKSLSVLGTFAERYPKMKANGEVAYLTGENYVGLEDWKEAMSSFKSAIDGDVASPFLERSYLGMGRSEEALGNYEKALKFLEDALSKHKDSMTGALARFEIGNVKVKMMEYEEAAKAYMMVAILYDDEDLCSKALFLAATNFQKAGKPKEAIDAFNELIKRYPQNPLSKKAETEIKKAQGEAR
ncbi:MAG: tetratricopeptide repeat protein, partial [Candidatus Omnitrophota bacterium]